MNKLLKKNKEIKSNQKFEGNRRIIRKQLNDDMQQPLFIETSL